MSKISKTDHRQSELFRNRLSQQLNPQHELLILNRQIDWATIEENWSGYFDKTKAGRKAKPARLIAGLLILQHMHNLSDEEVVKRWVENPYYQHFCGYDYLQWCFPINPSSLTRWRQRLGEEGVLKLLKETIQVGLDMGVVSDKSFQNVIVDTTVQEKNIEHPTDSKLFDRTRQKLVDLCKQESVPLRQNYNKVSKVALIQVGRYVHASQFKRMRKKVKEIKNYLGRVVRDIDRKIDGNDDLILKFQHLLEMAKRLMQQTKTSKNKLYSIHEQDVQCIAKGKARKKYEFGCKVSLAVTLNEGFVLNAGALEGNPYDGHTLQETLTQTEKHTGTSIKKVFVDKGYKGHGINDKEIYISGMRKLSPGLKRMLKRRSMIEPMIGHMKNDGKLGRNYLKGVMGDKINAILCAVGHNFRLLINAISFLHLFLRSIILTYCKKGSPWSGRLTYT